MKYCSNCGSPVRQGIPDGDDRPRFICDRCGTVHYHNPKLIVGCIPVWNGQVLLCRRAIDPRKGYWTLPAGFMEQGETLAHGAAREAMEEANVKVELGELYTLFSLPHISQVYAFFHARMTDGRFFPGAESLETQLFGEEEIPWDDIAFETVHRSLTYYFDERKRGEYCLHVEEIGPDARRIVAGRAGYLIS
jgi:ADP-ribose pyrophosphatase YjhB (NUDIX family)